jgi:hypothetical protein
MVRGEASAVAGARIPGRRQLAQGTGGYVHGEPPGLAPSLVRCLASTNIIESPHSGVRLRTRPVCHWHDGRMVLRRAAAAFLMTEKSFQALERLLSESEGNHYLLKVRYLSAIL